MIWEKYVKLYLWWINRSKLVNNIFRIWKGGVGRMKRSLQRMMLSMAVCSLIGLVVAEVIAPLYNHAAFKIIMIGAGGIAGWFWQYSLYLKFINLLRKIPGQEIVLKGVGLLFGLLVAALLTVILKPFLDLLTFREKLGLELILLFITLEVSLIIASVKAKELSGLLARPVPNKHLRGESQLKVLDTSAIIDGRIADLCRTGFLEGVLVIPGFVLGELQKIADSADPLRRNRGRRGLDLLNRMQKENGVTLKIFDHDYEDLTEVDTKLLKLAREMEAKVITNDFNLNKVAELYGVRVLNINELSNAIKPLVLPGEEMTVHVLRDGKEYGQGIGYLDDGTMIVVEGGKNYIGLDLGIMVTSVLQTAAGRMIFAKPKEYLYSKVTS
jgi:uncharacterized protein YacL